MADGETLNSLAAGENDGEEQREDEASSPSQRLLGTQQKGREETTEMRKVSTDDADAEHQSTKPYFLPNDEPCQEIRHQLTESETEAMYAHVQKTVDDLMQPGHFAATERPHIEEQYIAFDPETCNNSTGASASAPALIPRTELFRKIATRLVAGRHSSTSSEWKTIDSISEVSNKENPEPMPPLQKEVHSVETVLGKSGRNTDVPSWMAYNLKKANKKPSDLQLAPFSFSSKKRQKASPNSRHKIRSKPNVIIRAGENGPESYFFSPIPISYNRAYVHRPSTPSIHSSGSELDCASPLFLKSCEGAIRGSRDLGKLCGGLSARNVRRTVSTQQVSRLDARILEWLRGIDIDAYSQSSSESVVKFKGDFEPRKFARSEARTSSEELQGRSLKCPRRVLDVLWDEAISSGSNNALPLDITVPPLVALKDISNLRRPNYLARNSFARLETTSKAKLASRKARPILSTRIGKTQAPSHNMTPRTARQPAGNSSPRFQQLLNKRRRHEQTISMFSFETKIARRDQFEYPLACLEGCVSCRVACERRDVRSQHFMLTQQKSRRRTFRGKSAALVERADEPTTSTFSFELDEERRKHLEFSLARLEGRVEPKTPSPIQRFVHTEGVYSEHVEWERGSTEVAKPVAEETNLSGDMHETGTKYPVKSDGVCLKGGKDPLDQYGPVEVEEAGDSVKRQDLISFSLRGLMKRILKMVLEPLIEGMD